MSWRAVVVVALSVLCFAVVVPPMFSTFPTAYSGAHIDPGIATPTIQSVDPGSPAERAGLRAGDRIGCIDTRDLMVLAPFSNSVAYEPNPIHLCVTNVVPARQVSFYPRRGPQSQPFYGGRAGSVLRVLSYLVFLLVGCLLVILRPSLTTWLLFGYCLASAPAAAAYQALTTWPPQPYGALIAVLHPTTAVASACLLLFALVVPEERVPSGWRGAAFWITTVAASVFVGAQFFYRTLVSGFYRALDPLTIDFTRVATVAVVVVVMLRLLTMRADERPRFSWAAVAIVIGVITNDLRQGQYGLAGFFGTLTIVMPLTLMYAIVRRHVIDVRFVISRAVVYGALMTIVFAIIAAADWAATRFLAEMRVALALDAIIAIAFGVLMHRLTPMLEGWVDSVIYRKKHAAEVYLRRLARTLPRAEREETVDRALVEDPYGELDLTMAALFRRTESAFTIALSAGLEEPAVALDRDGDLVRFMIVERSCVHIGGLNDRVAATLADLGSPAIAIPIFNGDDLVSFVLYGVHRDGTRLDPDEETLLESLGESAGQAYVRVENSRLRALVGSNEKALGLP
jgi:hypothetical protein